MILYTKNYWGLPLLWRIYGSAFPRTIPFALISGVIALILEWTVGEDKDGRPSTAREWWQDPYPYQTFAFIVGFMLVFRSNFGYGRYWEGRSTLQVMSAKWSDVVTQVLNFDMGTLPADLDDEGKRRARRFGDTFVHLISLLHAVALQSLRRDWELSNLRPHDQGQPEPPMDPRYIKDAVKKGLNFMSVSDITHLRSGLTHVRTYNAITPLGVVGGITDDEFVGMGIDVKDMGADDPGVLSRGARLSNGAQVPGPAERVQVVMSWVHQIIQERQREGGLAIEGPILARAYQVLSEGMLGYEQSRKIMDTPFPFPWVQFVTVCLLLYALTVPIVISSYITEDWLAFMLTIFAVMTYYALNEVARDLEDPYVYDPNDLPMARHQYAFNERILSLSGTKRPFSPTELGIARLRTIVRRDQTNNSMVALPTFSGFAHDTVGSPRPPISMIGGKAPRMDLQLFATGGGPDLDQVLSLHGAHH
ncbi:unnamed protein product [Ostreobium quekettii]|uniref:Bestrophin/UPF0187 n=1 Tax=Ostreobium quekettii TaxID=121088 RepID=A0A8S1IXG9_9CHLO|nr:unnamed protein product [Ostreobium quekettii]|eukprot:evm.model.scf_481.4 EVM.evm.TU.scf_481.4   scf_481:34617-39739(+)